MLILTFTRLFGNLGYANWQSFDPRLPNDFPNLMQTDSWLTAGFPPGKSAHKKTPPQGDQSHWSEVQCPAGAILADQCGKGVSLAHFVDNE